MFVSPVTKSWAEVNLEKTQEKAQQVETKILKLVEKMNGSGEPNKLFGSVHTEPFNPSGSLVFKVTLIHLTRVFFQGLACVYLFSACGQSLVAYKIVLATSKMVTFLGPLQANAGLLALHNIRNAVYALIASSGVSFLGSRTVLRNELTNNEVFREFIKKYQVRAGNVGPGLMLFDLFKKQQQCQKEIVRLQEIVTPSRLF